jgi:hypothetical protein
MKMKTKKSVFVLLLLSCPFFLFACDSGNGSGNNGAAVSSGAGSGASGIFTINTSGADGGPDGGSGGDGGYVDIQMYYGSIGPFQVLANGAADASFTPTAFTPNLGDNPLAITADTTITVEVAEPAAGTPYLILNSPILRISDGNLTLSDETPVTGISVAAGATLTLALNYTTYAWVTLSNDIDNDGTITTDDNGALRGNLRLDLASYYGNSTIDTSGTLDGQSGGYVEIYPSYSFFNNGSINTSGADSTAGAAGDGGYVQIYANNYGIENTGNITTDGGAGSGVGTTGGSAGYLDWQAELSLYNSGNLSCRGGGSVDGGGGGSWIYLLAGNSSPGNLHNSGDLDTSGGDATSGDGGSGSSIDLYAYGGDIINSGNLTTKGGDTTDPDSNGGDGDYIYIEVYYQSSFSGVPNDDTPPGDVLFSGNVDASGGSAVTDAGATGSGGSGGNFEIYADYEYYPLGQQIALLGYSDIDTSGGDGNDGGTGGYVDLFCDYGNDWRTGLDTASCSITNEVDINATGGSVVAAATNIPADGGNGGYVEMETDYDWGVFYPDIDKVTNSGNIDTSGGESLESNLGAGYAGYVWIWGYNGVTNNGNITAGGGDDFGTDGGITGSGSDADAVQIYAELGPVSNSGNLTTDGGGGEFAGGNANVIELFGPEVSNNGALAANGGDADPSLAGSVGGAGDDVELFSPGGMQGITQTGTVTNDGGTGAAPGSDGNYYLGGQLL